MGVSRSQPGGNPGASAGLSGTGSAGAGGATVGMSGRTGPRLRRHATTGRFAVRRSGFDFLRRFMRGYTPKIAEANLREYVNSFMS